MKKIRNSALSSGRTCHNGPVEVVKNLYCGSEDEARTMMLPPNKVDTLVPLNDLDAVVWDLGFRGEIIYCPIKDFGTLPDDVLNGLVSKILDRIGREEKVGLFCMGGHGRTGYIASVVLGRLGIKDPIGFLRSGYCKKAVESNAQIEHIAKILNMPELVEKYETQSRFGILENYRFDGFGLYNSDADYFPKTPGYPTCGDCIRFMMGICKLYKIFTDKEDSACEFFLEDND